MVVLDPNFFLTVRYSADGLQDWLLSKLKSSSVIEEGLSVFNKHGEDDVPGLQEFDCHLMSVPSV